MLSLRLARLMCAFVLGSLVMANPAAAGQDLFPVGFGFTNPCTQSVVVVSGDAYGTYTNQGSKHVIIYRAAAENQDYRLNLIANGTFTEPTGVTQNGNYYFDVPYRAIVVGQGQAPDFQVEGTNRIIVNAASGQITSAQTVGSATTTCLG